MAAKRPEDRTIGDLMRSVPPRLKQIKLSAFMAENADHSIVLLSVAMLDRALRDALTLYLKPSISPDESDMVFEDTKDGPLATFSAKIRLAYALGIFGPRTNKDLKKLGRIRNAFAHVTAHLNFATPEIEKECFALEVSVGHKKDAKTRFLVAFWVYWGALSGYRLNDNSLIQEKFRKDLV